jgi:hypothetical protein
MSFFDQVCGDAVAGQVLIVDGRSIVPLLI